MLWTDWGLCLLKHLDLWKVTCIENFTYECLTLEDFFCQKCLTWGLERPFERISRWCGGNLQNKARRWDGSCQPKHFLNSLGGKFLQRIAAWLGKGYTSMKTELILGDRRTAGGEITLITCEAQRETKLKKVICMYLKAAFCCSLFKQSVFTRVGRKWVFFHQVLIFTNAGWNPVDTS